MRCAVSNCGNNNRNGNRKKWRYFHFPKDKQQLQKWIEFCQRDIANTATACICNEHFTPNDFERNMQYELGKSQRSTSNWSHKHVPIGFVGFTRKNPTKLKPNSYPTIRGQQHKALARGRRGKAKKDEETHINDGDCFPMQNEAEDATDVHIELLDCSAELAESERDELIEFTISEMEDYGAANEATAIESIDLEIIDSLNPQTNIEEHVEYIDTERDSYVKHLEIEVSTLKRQVFFLQDERKKLIDEIQNLRATVRNENDKEAKSVEKISNVNANEMVCLYRLLVTC
ncbi:hypothetical protein KR044_008071 [Drosophila immigrans]|nr:hypothetical protein KR044_008071 [Drosophila immigrans]